MFRRRRTVTPEMRAAFARQMADAPSHEAVLAGLERVFRSLHHLADNAPLKRRYAESGAAHELEFYGGGRTSGSAECPCVEAGSPRDWCWIGAAPHCRYLMPNRNEAGPR